MNSILARAVADWRFYFHEAKAAIGISSSWEPLAYIAQCGGASKSTWSDRNTAESTEQKRLAASRRHARIEAALKAMEPDAVGLVRLTCEAQTQILRLAFGELGNVAHLSEAARREHRRSQTKRDIRAWLDRLAWKSARQTASPASLNAISDIRRSCELVMGWPRDEYVKALGRVG